MCNVVDTLGLKWDAENGGKTRYLPAGLLRRDPDYPLTSLEDTSFNAIVTNRAVQVL